MYTKKKNSNVLFQLIDMSIQLFKHKFTLTTLPLTSNDLQAIIVLLYCQSKTLEEQSDIDDSVEILSQDMNSLLETLSLTGGSQTQSEISFEII